MTQPEFNSAYWAHEPAEVRALKDIADDQARCSRAIELATKGYVIDVPIMAWGSDPYQTMRLRQSYGYTWVPSALMDPIIMSPGLHLNTLPDYDPNRPPAGSIKVSLDPADYPPADPPAPAPPPQTAAPATPVGAQCFANTYYSTPGDTAPDGTRITEARGVFAKHRVLGPFGPSQYWEKVA